jgi:hypothetical protein
LAVGYVADSPPSDRHFKALETSGHPNCLRILTKTKSNV